jgi:hypothetical protein
MMFGNASTSGTDPLAFYFKKSAAFFKGIFYGTGGGKNVKQKSRPLTGRLK